MPPFRPIEDRLLEKIAVHPLGCWEWTASLTKDGYGAFGIGSRVTTAHRAMWEVTFGEIPEGLTLDHLCRNRRCLNTAHLEPVTRGENVLRGMGRAADNARKTHCHRGHPFDKQNTYIVPGGGRQCRACNRERRRYVDR